MASAFFLPLLEDGTRARRKCRETARTLEARGLESTGEGNIRWANGDEALEFANGSLLWVVAPHAGAFRSEAADAMLFDEAGELDPVKSEDLLAGALPLLDTRPMRQAIIAGTPAKTRAGLLWDTIEEGRRGDPGAGIVEYSIRDDEPSVLHPDGPDGPAVLNVEVLRRVHPGVGTLTTMAWMEQRFAKMDLATFEREYLCRFPFDASSSAIDLDSGAAAAVPVLPRPERFGLAFDVAPDGSSAACALRGATRTALPPWACWSTGMASPGSPGTCTTWRSVTAFRSATTGSARTTAQQPTSTGCAACAWSPAPRRRPRPPPSGSSPTWRTGACATSTRPP